MTVWSLAAAMPVQWKTLRALMGLGACGSTYQVDLAALMKIIAYAFRHNTIVEKFNDKTYFKMCISHANTRNGCGMYMYDV